MPTQQQRDAIPACVTPTRGGAPRYIAIIATVVSAPSLSTTAAEAVLINSGQCHAMCRFFFTRLSSVGRHTFALGGR